MRPEYLVHSFLFISQNFHRISNTKNRSTPLHNAAYYGHTNAVKQLIQGGAQVNVYNSNQITPLHSGTNSYISPCQKTREKFPLISYPIRFFNSGFIEGLSQRVIEATL